MKNKSLVFMAAFFSYGLLHAGSYIDQAEVVSVQPVRTDKVIREPYDDCYIKEFYEGDSDGSATNEIIGGIFGGLIGNQFGDGDGKDVMTLAGTILGASLAHDDEKAKSNTGKVVRKEICERKYRTITERRISHYRVEYFYHGNSFTYTTNNPPQSNIINVDVSVTPR
jgi:uncharacterized protein YcfJ